MTETYGMELFLAQARAKGGSDEWKWDIIRHARNQMLRDTDWTQLPDSPVDKAAWAAYRQALRDIPQTFSDPDKISLPAAPDTLPAVP